MTTTKPREVNDSPQGQKLGTELELGPPAWNVHSRAFCQAAFRGQSKSNHLVSVLRNYNLTAQASLLVYFFNKKSEPEGSA